jgi:uncharacterized membrane protein YeaQ/YmgE (transglycosylase-associated protein family)
MSELELSPLAQHWANAVLLWLGFGIVAGLLAKLLLPGRKPAGPWGTLVIGILGSFVGPLAVSTLWQPNGFNPISPVGLLASVGGALCFLAVYRFFVTVAFGHASDEFDD